MSRRMFAIICLVVIAVSAPQVLHAIVIQDQAQPSTVTSPFTADEIVEILESELSLTTDQVSQITPVIIDRQHKLKILMGDKSGRRIKRLRQAKSIMKDSDKKINTILTPEQQKKYAKMEQEMRDRMKQKLKQKKSQGRN